MEFGKILKRKREERRMTQEEVAERLGSTKQNISSYESGYKVAPLRIVIGAADMFRCSLDEMIGRDVP